MTNNNNIQQLDVVDRLFPAILTGEKETTIRWMEPNNDMTGFGLMLQEQLSLGWNTASGGEKRRALLTRTLIQNPELIVIDEPFNHLDSSSRGQIVRAIGDFLQRRKGSVILCTHDGIESYTSADFSDLTVRHIAL